MFSSKSGIKLLLLVVLIALLAQDGESGKKVVRMRYKIGDWRPHFGFHRPHLASQHRHLNRPRNHTSSYNTSMAARTALGHVLANKPILLEQYVARLVIGHKELCSGIIVSPTLVLTVVTCIVNVPLDQLQVKLQDGSLYAVNDATTAPGYSLDEEHLTLLHLTSSMDHMYEQRPPICWQAINAPHKVIIWSLNRQKTFTKTKDVPLIATNSCKEILHSKNGTDNHDGTICVMNKKITKKCEPTFGLPYEWQGKFCGINLLGHNCPNPRSVDVYVPLIDKKLYVAKKVIALRNTKLEDELI
ncbi:uncharacterized protein LOC115621946 [Scaptodrosophila lebanonensis]|uniref:Uncharacterized protein LOC115621946 n=1 Tax=Drosophila lebanonensis TaxID=7225 RepID=A0A6J2T934_DROLE|nr:uncharacterized protein LOC115621946 [Scaptodrosophila lebanonensis]